MSTFIIYPVLMRAHDFLSRLQNQRSRSFGENVVYNNSSSSYHSSSSSNYNSTTTTTHNFNSRADGSRFGARAEAGVSSSAPFTPPPTPMSTASESPRCECNCPMNEVVFPSISSSSSSSSLLCFFFVVLLYCWSYLLLFFFFVVHLFCC